MRALRQQPDVRLAQGFLTAEEQGALLRGPADPSGWAARGVAGEEDATGLFAELPVEDEPLLLSLRARVEALVGFESAIGDTFRYRRYEPGQSHPGHLDCYGFDDNELIATALIVLQHAAVGGQTVFPRAAPAPLLAQPTAGDLLLWWNHTPDGARDPLSWHYAAPVAQGAKITLAWFFYAPSPVAAHRDVTWRYSGVTATAAPR